MTQETSGSLPRFDWIDYLRALCAGIVLLNHLALVTIHPVAGLGISGFGLLTEIVRFGNIALFIFFLVSGMMITLVAQTQDAATFVTRRAARVYPMFVLCLTITTLLSPWGPDFRFDVSFGQYLANLTLNPRALGYRWVDASYWTLPVEITFYCAMTVVMLLGAMKNLQAVVATWVILQALTCYWPRDLPLIGYTYYFMAAGAVLALWYQRRNERLNLALLALSLVPCLRCVFVVSDSAGFNPWIGSAIVLGVFALFLLMRERTIELPGAQRIGSLTYPLYLLHFHVGIVLMRLLAIDESNKWWVLAAVVAILVAASLVIDDIVEFRMRPFWRRLFGATLARPVAWIERRRAASM
jgi:peptidoglycan/LPS O-acetylase OafA/YrhL